jgi:hypothetical protein
MTLEARLLLRCSRSLVLLGSAVVLSGCAASLAASAAGLAMRSAQGQPRSNEHLKPLAVQTCSDQAAQFGTVALMDVEQRTAGRIIVWGTATSQAGRQSFECTFTDRIAGFKLRPIKR